MKYSIITPVYNVGKYLRECIESVIAQTYTDWELILIDDGSTDDSASICDEYANKDSRIKVVHIENGGPYKVRILGKDYITGDYTVGLDGDDTYTLDCLEKIEQARAKSNADMIIFGRTEFYEIDGSYQPCMLSYDLGRIYEKEELLEKVIRITDHSLANKAVRAELYKKAKYIEEKYRVTLSDDRLQVVPLLCEVNSAYAIEDRLYIYRIRGASGSHNYRMEHIIDNDFVNSELRTFLKEEGYYTSEVERALEYSYLDAFFPRLYALRWKITAKEKSEIKKMPLLNSLTNDIDDLYGDKAHKLLLKYIKCGFWGPKSLVYKVILKYCIEPVKKRKKK